MNYGQIRKYDVSNAKGISTTLFIVGCNFNCYGCFNKEYQDFDYGNLWTKKEEDLIIDHMRDPNVTSFSLLGGEIFHQENLLELVALLKRIRENYPNKKIWLWSGYVYENIIKCQNFIDLLKLIDVLIDGQFEEDKKDLSLKFRGSQNQRIICVQESLKQNKVILYDI